MKSRAIAFILSLFILCSPVGAQENTTASITDNSTIVINDFWVNIQTGNAPLHTNFSANVTGNVTSYLWTFEPVGPDYYSKHFGSAVHTFKKPGVYNITLTVTGPAGNASMTKEMYINVTDPKAVNEAPLQSSRICVYEVWKFGAGPMKLSNAWYTWNFGDGCKTTTKCLSVKHAFTKAGTYKVTCKAVGKTCTKSGYATIKVGL